MKKLLWNIARVVLFEQGVRAPLHSPVLSGLWIFQLLFLSDTVKAQTEDVDSIRAVLQQQVEDTAMAHTLYALSSAYWIRNLDSAEAAAHRLMELSERLDFTFGLGRAHNSLGVIHWYRGEYSTAALHHEKNYEYDKKTGNKYGMASSLYNLGIVYEDQGDLQKAHVKFLEALRIYEEIGSRTGISRIHNIVGVIYSTLGDHWNALKEHEQAKLIREELQDEWGLSETYSNMGLTYMDLGDLENSAHYHRQALDLREKLDDRQGIAISHNNLGYLCTLQGEYDRAMDHLQRARTIDSELGYRKGSSSVELNLGRLYSAMGRHQKAYEHKRRSLKLAEEIGAADYAHAALKELAVTAARLGLHSQAYAYRTRYQELNDSIYSAQRNRELIRERMEYDFARRHFEDSVAHAAAMAQADMEHQIQLVEQRNQRNYSIIAGAVILLAALGLWSRLAYIRRSKDIILRQQRELLISEKQRETEQVRTRIARDMHDEIGSELTKISMLVSEVRHEPSNGSDHKSVHLERIAKLSSQVHSSLNDIVWAVDPHQDSVASLVLHAQMFVDRMLEGTDLQRNLNFQHKGPDRNMDPATKRNIFLLLKESLNNSIKYSHASRMDISLITTQKEFELIVEDNGVGFDPQSVGEVGNGLRNLKARAKATDADIRIDASPGKGCRIKVSGPLS